MTTTETTDFVTDMFKQATDNFNRTMRTGIEFQERTTKFWKDTFDQGLDQFRSEFERAEKTVKDAVPDAKENLAKFHKMFDEQAKNSLDALRGSFAGGEGLDAKNFVDQTTKLWSNSFNTMRSNADTLVETNVEMFERFNEMTKKGCATNGHKTARTTSK